MEMQNQDIWFGYIKLVELSMLDLPIETSAMIVSLLNILKEPYQEIETKRLILLRKYGKKDKKTQRWVVSPLSDNAIKLAADFGAILIQERDLPIEKAKLPRSVKRVCGKCHESIETSFLVSPDILAPLLGIFVEIDE